MAKRKEQRVEGESGLSGTDEQAETKAIESWLRIVDKPLVKENQDREGAEPRDE